MPDDVLAHEFAQYLSGRLVLRPADLKKLFAQIALDSYSQTDIFHNAASVPNGYTFE